jgi:hypothetical protein
MFAENPLPWLNVSDVICNHPDLGPAWSNAFVFTIVISQYNAALRYTFA